MSESTAPAGEAVSGMRRRAGGNYGVTARARRGPEAPEAGPPRPLAATQSANSVATCGPEAARAAASGTVVLGSPARAMCRAASPWSTTASHPAPRVRAATRPASRPRPSASAAPRTSPHAAPQVPLARQALSTRAPPGGGLTAPGFPAPQRATTAWADTPPGPSQVRTEPAPARHDSSISLAAGRLRRRGAGSPRAPAAAKWSSAVAAEMGTSPGSGGPTSRRDRGPTSMRGRPRVMTDSLRRTGSCARRTGSCVPRTGNRVPVSRCDRRGDRVSATLPANLPASVPRRIPAAASTSAMTAATSVSQFTLPGALSSTTAWTSTPTNRDGDGSARWEADAWPSRRSW